MKRLLTIAATLILAACATAQTTFKPVQTSNGVVTDPNFWTANSNAINAVVPVPPAPTWDTLSNKPTWISTNAATSQTNLGLGAFTQNLEGGAVLKSADGTEVVNVGDSISFLAPFSFDGTNAADNKAATLAGLGLGASWLTNTNSPLFELPPVTTLASSYDGTNPALRYDGPYNEIENGGGWFIRDTNDFRRALGVGTTNNVTFNRVTTSAGGYSAPGVQVGPSNTGLISVSGYLFGVSRGAATFSSSSNTFSVPGELAGSHLSLFGTNASTFGGPLAFSATNAAAATAANLGLGATNSPTFAGLRLTTLTNASTTLVGSTTNGALTNLSGVPAAGAPENAEYRNIGGTGAWVASQRYFAQQATNSPANTNTTAFLSDGVTLTVSNVPAGTYQLRGFIALDGGATKEFGLVVPHNTVNPRAVFGSATTGTMQLAFSSATNMLFSQEAATGVRQHTVFGFVITTNTGDVTLRGRAAVTNSTNPYIVAGSFLELLPVPTP